MPVVGILRQHPDNSYLLIAHSREDDTLKKIDYYHESSARAKTFKKRFESALIVEDGKALKVDEGYLFTGEEPFLFFEISEGQYKKIFDNAKKTTQRLVQKWKEEHERSGLKYNIEKEFERHLPCFEKDEAAVAAHEAGYNGERVNAKPRIVFAGIGQGIPQPDWMTKPPSEKQVKKQ